MGEGRPNLPNDKVSAILGDDGGDGPGDVCAEDETEGVGVVMSTLDALVTLRLLSAFNLRAVASISGSNRKLVDE